MSLGFDLNGKFYETDEDGYIQKLEDWNEEVADYIAKTEDIELKEDHWKVVNYLRGYYEEYKIAPMIRVVLKWMGKNLGPEKGTNKYLYEIFPSGPAKQACKIAGMAKPTGCV
jgi:tRNA 2-thiouridine synthesizing protein E